MPDKTRPRLRRGVPAAPPAAPRAARRPLLRRDRPAARQPQLAKTFIDQASAGAPFERPRPDRRRLPRGRAAHPGRDRGRGLRRRGPRLAHHERAAGRPDRATCSPSTTGFHTDHGAGELLERIDGDVAATPGSSPASSSRCSAARSSSSACWCCCSVRTGASARCSPRSRWPASSPHPRRGFVGRRSRGPAAPTPSSAPTWRSGSSALPDLKANGADGHHGGSTTARRAVPRRAPRRWRLLFGRANIASSLHGHVAGDGASCSSAGASPWAASTRVPVHRDAPHAAQRLRGT